MYKWISALIGGLALTACAVSTENRPVSQAGPLDKYASLTSVTSPELLNAGKGRLYEFLSCLKQNNIAIVGAHRAGARPEFPENALSSMDRVSSDIPVFIETDVQMSKDGVLFMHHDNDLSRTTTGKGDLRELNWSEISALSLRDPTGRPTDDHPERLVDILKWAHGRAILLLDVKPATDIAKVIEAVGSVYAEDRVMYIVYRPEQALRAREVDPDAVLAVPLVRRELFENFKNADILKENIIGMARVSGADQALVSDIKKSGVLIMSGAYGNKSSADALYSGLQDALHYHALVERGASLVVSNRPYKAVEAMSVYPGYRNKLTACGVD